jgi:16S rRNA (cytidine1402-2'-O)-methyltransferase
MANSSGGDAKATDITPADQSSPERDPLAAGHSSAVVARTAAEIARALAAPLPPGLYLVATPIGNLADITVRALATLSRCDVIYCEDTRHSRTLLSHYGVTVRLEAYHEHNGTRERPRILARLAAGQRVALISDAGTPLISDPGYKLVRDVAAAGHRIESLPGASAALTALTSSGLPSDAFFFAGFLPNKPAARRSRATELKSIPGTVIFFEAPSRVADSLADLAAVMGPRPAAVARELTKRFETILRGPLNELALAFADQDARGEFVILIGPQPPTEATDDDIADALSAALENMSLRDAAKTVAERLAVPKSRVYDLGLDLQKSLSQPDEPVTEDGT